MHANSLQLCQNLCRPINCSLPDSSVHGIFRARILEWIAMPFSMGSSRPRRKPFFLTFNLHWKAGSLPLEAPRKPPLKDQINSVQLLSRVQLCDPMNRSMPGLPVHHQLPEFTQTHVHRVSDAIQPSYPLLSPSPPALNLSQHQGLFKWVSPSHQVAKVLEFQLQHQSLQWTPRTDLLQDGLVGSPCSPRESQEFSPTLQFKNINSSVLSFLYSPTVTSIQDHWKNHSLDQTDLCWQSNVSAF